jgi:HEPN domain-containing protein
MTAAIDKQARVLLAKAAEDEAVVHLAGVPDGPFGFHVQQTVEKLLKALLSQLSIQYRLSHDLSYLVNLLQTSGEVLPKTVLEFSELESFAVFNRYDDIPEFQILDRPAAIETIRILRAHIEARMAALSGPPLSAPLQ